MTDKQKEHMWTLSSEHMSDLAIETLNAFLTMAKNAHTIDIYMRADGRDYKFQADVFKYIKYLPVYRNDITSDLEDANSKILSQKMHRLEKKAIRFDKVIEYLSGEIDGDSPIDQTLSKAIDILEGRI